MDLIEIFHHEKSCASISAAPGSVSPWQSPASREERINLALPFTAVSRRYCCTSTQYIRLHLHGYFVATRDRSRSKLLCYGGRSGLRLPRIIGKARVFLLRINLSTSYCPESLYLGFPWTRWHMLMFRMALFFRFPPRKFLQARMGTAKAALCVAIVALVASEGEAFSGATAIPLQGSFPIEQLYLHFEYCCAGLADRSLLAPVKAPVKAPTKAPVKAPASAPTKAPAKAPTYGPLAPGPGGCTSVLQTVTSKGLSSLETAINKANLRCKALLSNCQPSPCKSGPASACCEKSQRCRRMDPTKCKSLKLHEDFCRDES